MSIAATMCRWLRISICSSGGENHSHAGVILIDLQQMRTDGKIMGYQGSDFGALSNFRSAPARRSSTSPAIRNKGRRRGRLRFQAPHPGHFAGWRLYRSRPTGASHRLTPRRPGKRSATGRCYQAHGAALLPGGGWRLTRPTVRSSQPLTYPPATIRATETAGVAASTSLRRSRKARAARMDAG